MRTRIKKGIYIITILVAGMSLTGCGNFLQYHMRQDPGEAMEEYLEEKYDDDVTCIGWSTGDGSLIAYWNQSGSDGEFISKKYPGVTISCGAHVKEDGWTYEFNEDYQKQVYRPGVQTMMEDIASKYFEGDYCVVVKTIGGDDETVKAMPFEEYVRGYRLYSVSILTEEMSDEDAIETMQEFVTDAQSRGFQYHYLLGRANTNIISKDRYYERLMAEDYDVLRKGNGIESFTKWLYIYTLPFTEGESEPDIYIITEEEE